MATAKIASIFWEPLRAERLYPGGPFKIAGIAPGRSPAILTVEDVHQTDYGAYGPNNKREIIERLVTASSIAFDLVSEWATRGVQMGATCHPGVWHVRETMPMVNPDGTLIRDAKGVGRQREASEQEKAEMWAEDLEANTLAQREYGQIMYDIGEATYNEEPRKRPWIHRHAFGAAKHYGMEAEWLKKGSERATQPCPVCTAIISKNALKCPKCGGIVNIAEYAKREVATQEAISTEKAALRQLQKTA